MASRSAYDDYDEDYRSDLDAKYEEGFGQSPDLGYDDEDDDLFAGLFDDIDADAEDDDVSSSAGKSPVRGAAARKPVATKPAIGKTKEPTATSVVTTRVSASGVKMTLASPTKLIVTKAEPEELRAAAEALAIDAPIAAAAPDETASDETPSARQVDPAIAALADAASRARVAAESAGNAAKRAVADAVAKAAAAKAAAAEASAAEEAAQAALARSTEAEEAARAAAERLAEAQRAAVEAAESQVEAESEPAAAVVVHESAVVAESAAVTEPAAAVEPAVVTDPLFAPAIAPVNEHVNFLRKLRPGLEVPYVDPMHSVEECRIVSLFSNTGEANPKGFVWAGDDAAATRLLGLQFQLGLRPEWILPWNTYPWFTPGEANGKLLPEHIQAGLKPLIALLKVLPRASAIVAHGPEANRLAQMLLKTDNPLIWRRGLKVYKARSLHGRAFAGSKERQTEWLIEMGKAYADAMARAGLQLRR
jgi:hypothetical protein